MQMDQNIILAVVLTAIAIIWIGIFLIMIVWLWLFNVKRKNTYDFLIFKCNKYGVTAGQHFIGRKDEKDNVFILVNRFTGRKIKQINAELTENHMYNNPVSKNRTWCLLAEKDRTHSQLKFGNIPEDLGIKAIRSDVFSFILAEGKKLLDKYAKKDTDLNKTLLIGTFTVLSLTVILLIVSVAIIFTIGPDTAGKMQALKSTGNAVQNAVPQVPG
jgi:hypothetical protein